MDEPRVFLLGAGPGDPDLLTLKAVRVLQEADAVVYDRLIGTGILDHAPASAARVYVGKTAGRPCMTQDQINRLLVNLAQRHRRLVRLKGGDPFVFGRGGEEALHLLRNGIPFEVVPGVTAALGCAAACGIPLTHRGVASGVRFVTGHGRDGWWLDYDWTGLADPDTTLVLYMALAHVGEIARRLIGGGLSPSTPGAAIASATTPKQRLLRAPLVELDAAVAAAGLQSPVTFVIGRVVDLLLVAQADEMGLDAENHAASA
jgi:uroporphyrin-III C-methyltransferase/precorrin-2 dehydrogenase/sirohydrochlorin ferrochelatase/uroporphyrin-III C-methyltransferase